MLRGAFRLFWGDHTDVSLPNAGAPLVRLTIARLRHPVKDALPIQFVPQALTCYGALELLRRYVQRLDLARRLRVLLGGLGGDYGGHRLVVLVLCLLYSGGRRLEQ